MALFRIAMGLGVWATVLPVVVRGLVPVLWFDASDGGYRSLGDGPWLVQWLGGMTPTVVWGLTMASLVTSAGMVAGIGGRTVSFACLLCTAAVVDFNGHAGGSYDELLTNGLWLAVLAGGYQTLSVTAWRRTGRWWPDAEALAFVRWLALWQLALMYGTSALQKVSAYWVPGGESSALYYILQQPNWHRVDMEWLAYVFPLTQLATTGTWLWEVTAPLWVLAVWWSVHPERPGRLRRWSNRLELRWVYAVVGIGMHAMILFTMEVGPFSFLSLGFYVCLVHPWEWAVLRDRVSAR